MTWQAEAELWFRMPGGYFIGPLSRGGSVVVGPMPNQAATLRFLTEMFGSEPRQVEGVYLWRDPVPVLTDPGADRKSVV